MVLFVAITTTAKPNLKTVKRRDWNEGGKIKGDGGGNRGRDRRVIKGMGKWLRNEEGHWASGKKINH